jgi:hypothetical protein
MHRSISTKENKEALKKIKGSYADDIRKIRSECKKAFDYYFDEIVLGEPFENIIYAQKSEGYEEISGVDAADAKEFSTIAINNVIFDSNPDCRKYSTILYRLLVQIIHPKRNYENLIDFYNQIFDADDVQDYTIATSEHIYLVRDILLSLSERFRIISEKAIQFIEKQKQIGPEPEGEIDVVSNKTLDWDHIIKLPPKFNDLFEALHDYVIANKPIDVKHREELKDILEKNEFPQAFKHPTGEDGNILYRGAALNEASMRKLLKIGPEDKIPEMGEQNISVEIKPKSSEGHSTVAWTYSFNFAKGFSVKNARISNGSNPYMVVFYSNVEENKENLLDMWGIYSINGISDLKGFSNEHEVLGLSGIKAYKVRWKFLRKIEV